MRSIGHMINSTKSDCKATGQMATYLTVQKVNVKQLFNTYLTVEKITVKHVANWPVA